MTTSWAWMAHGHPIRAFLTQPMGAFLFVAAAVACLASFWFLFTGGTVEKKLQGRGRWMSAIFITCGLAAWIYKIVETVAR